MTFLLLNRQHVFVSAADHVTILNAEPVHPFFRRDYPGIDLRFVLENDFNFKIIAQSIDTIEMETDIIGKIKMANLSSDQIAGIRCKILNHFT